MKFGGASESKVVLGVELINKGESLSRDVLSAPSEGVRRCL